MASHGFTFLAPSPTFGIKVAHSFFTTRLLDCSDTSPFEFDLFTRKLTDPSE